MSAVPPISIAILSDLHLDIRRRHLLRAGHAEKQVDAIMGELQTAARDAARDADVVVLAGDICEGAAGIAWGGETFSGQPVVYVAGNHEFYRHDHATLLQDLRKAAAATGNVRLLENDCLTLDVRGIPLRIPGCTLWTDYRLYGEALMDESMARAAQFLLDHQRIKWRDDAFFQPVDAQRLHEASRAWLMAELARPWAGKTVVVTHHAPADLSTAPQFTCDPLSPAFASDLSPLMLAHAPALWVHGHTHHNVDYSIGATRVVAHQWGYPKENMTTDVKIVAVY